MMVSRMMGVCRVSRVSRVCRVSRARLMCRPVCNVSQESPQLRSPSSLFPSGSAKHAIPSSPFLLFPHRLEQFSSNSATVSASAGIDREALHAELRAHVRARRIETLAAEALESLRSGGAAAPPGRSGAVAELVDDGLASRTIYIGGGGDVVTAGDVRAIVEGGADYGAGMRPRLRGVRLARGWALAELGSDSEVSCNTRLALIPKVKKAGILSRG